MVSQIYDPLGLLSPVVITTKITLQKLWLSKIGWDDPLPQPLVHKWKEFLSSLNQLNTIRIPRHAVGRDPIRTELHLFTDASEAAYGACAYIRTCDRLGKVTVHLLCAKSRVAPIKPVSMPRLELCGALTGARLLSKISSSLRLQFDKIVFWIDSTIVLAWLKMPPSSLKTFVQNRVIEINELAGSATFLHISGKINPANILSRGSSLNDLINCDLWWYGPRLLHEEILHYENEPISIEGELPEIKNININLASTVTDLKSFNSFFDFNRFSSFRKMQHTFAYILRIVHNLKNKNNRLNGALSVTELKNSLNFLVVFVQRQSFPK